MLLQRPALLVNGPNLDFAIGFCKRILSAYVVQCFVRTLRWKSKMRHSKNPPRVALFGLHREPLLTIPGSLLLVSLIFVLTAAAQTGPPDLRVFNNCPLQGDARPTALQQLNMLKNRFVGPGRPQINPAITLSAILAPGDDRQRWSVRHGAIITGFVVDVKPGGSETVNCHATDAAHTDTHIELAINPTSTAPNQIVVVEVTPRLRAI